MDKEHIKDIILNIFIDYLHLDKDYFSRFSDDGNNLFIVKDLGCDPLTRFEILERIEKKCGILISDEDVIWGNDLTIYQYINSIYSNIKNERL